MGVASISRAGVRIPDEPKITARSLVQKIQAAKTRSTRSLEPVPTPAPVIELPKPRQRRKRVIRKPVGTLPPTRSLALLIGINYERMSAQLAGCINDATNMRSMLIRRFGFSAADITVLTDKTSTKPTRANIVKALRTIVQETQDGSVDQIFVSYSGHGSYTADNDGDEADGRDECLVPLDHAHSGVIRDDEIVGILRKLHRKTRCVMFIDACHSGTACDLAFTFGPSGARRNAGRAPPVAAQVVMISGCRDSQTSADAYDLENDRKFSGAMTSALLSVLHASGYAISCADLITGIRRYLSMRGFAQVPQMSCSKQMLPKARFCRRAIVGRLGTFLIG